MTPSSGGAAGSGRQLRVHSLPLWLVHIAAAVSLVGTGFVLAALGIAGLRGPRPVPSMQQRVWWHPSWWAAFTCRARYRPGAGRP